MEKLLTSFLQGNCIFFKDKKISSEEIYQEFCNFIRSEGKAPNITKARLNELISDYSKNNSKDLKYKRLAYGMCWVGLAVKSDKKTLSPSKDKRETYNLHQQEQRVQSRIKSDKEGYIEFLNKLNGITDITSIYYITDLLDTDPKNWDKSEITFANVEYWIRNIVEKSVGKLGIIKVNLGYISEVYDDIINGILDIDEDDTKCLIKIVRESINTLTKRIESLTKSD